MVGAPFISMYLLEHVGMDLFHVLMLWTISWVGGRGAVQTLGQSGRAIWPAARARPVHGLQVRSTCSACWRAPPIRRSRFGARADLHVRRVFERRHPIANNGFLIKNSPRENRTMFVAAGTGLAGIVGGAASIVAGAAWPPATSGHGAGGTTYVNFHVLFAVSLVLRLASAGLATRISEPASARARAVAGELLVAARLRMQAWQAVVLWWREGARRPRHAAGLAV